MPKPEIVKSNSRKVFYQPLSQSYPEIHLRNTGAALILYTNPLPPESEGTIVVANFSERNSNLLMTALTKIDHGEKVYIKVVAQDANNELAKNILELLKNDAFRHQVTGMGLSSEIAALKIETTTNDFIVQFNSRLTLVPINAHTATPLPTKSNTSSFRDAIRNAFMKNPSKRSSDARINDENIDSSLKNKSDGS